MPGVIDKDSHRDELRPPFSLSYHKATNKQGLFGGGGVRACALSDPDHLTAINQRLSGSFLLRQHL